MLIGRREELKRKVADKYIHYLGWYEFNEVILWWQIDTAPAPVELEQINLFSL
jgi:hypothetical protein